MSYAKKTQGRYDKYEKEDHSVVCRTRSISPEEVLNLRNEEHTEMPYSKIKDSNANTIALGNNKISKIGYLPSKIIKLELRSNLISKIQNIESCILLKVLDLSINMISRIENLQTNTYLEELHLGDNQIKKIENLEMLKELKRLNMENNLLSSSASIRTLSLNPKIMFLVLKGNSFAIQSKYKPIITSLLPKLLFLDYTRLSSQGFKKNEHVFDFFSKPFLESDQNLINQSELAPKNPVNHKKKFKRVDSVRISTETQTFQANQYARADAEVQTFHDEVYIEPSRKSTLIAKDIKLPSFKNSSSNEITRIRKYYKSIGLFKYLPSSFIDILIKSSDYKAAQESELILHSEGVVEKLIVIIKGTIQYQNKLYTFGNCLFAESLIIPEEVKSDVISIEPCEYFILQKSDFEKILTVYPNYKELLMKNYLEKNMLSSDFELKLKKHSKNKSQDKPKLEKTKESKSLSKLNLKALISSKTSKDLGLPCLDSFSVTEDNLVSKVKKDIDTLLKVADPFDFTLEDPSNFTSNESKYEELSDKIDQLYSMYKKDIQLRKSKENIEEEAKSFTRNGFKSEVELIGMEREFFKKLMNSCVIEETGENLWMYEYVKSLDRANEDMVNILGIKSAEVREKIFSCQSALQTFLNQSSQSLSQTTIKNYRIILTDCELLKAYDEPYNTIYEQYGSHFSNEIIKQAGEEVINLMIFANKLKEALAQVLEAQELDDTEKLIQVRQQLQDQGLLLSQLNSSFQIIDKSISLQQ